MIRFPGKPRELSPETVVNTIWVSTFLAMILALPPLGVFLGIYHSTGNLAVGALLGFGLHFVTLAFSGRISSSLTSIISGSGSPVAGSR